MLAFHNEEAASIGERGREEKIRIERERNRRRKRKVVEREQLEFRTTRGGGS